MQTDGPGLNYIRASYRKQAAQVAGGNSRMLKNRSPAEAQASTVFSFSNGLRTRAALHLMSRKLDAVFKAQQPI